MIYALQTSRPDGETYIVRYQSEGDGGRLEAFCGPLNQEEQVEAAHNIASAPNWEYERFEDNDEYEQFEIAVVGTLVRAWFDSDTGVDWVAAT
jgi:hypothetical protein